MSQINVKGKNYRCGKIDAFQQLHVVRRIGPALIVAGISIEVLKSGAQVYFQDMMGMAVPIMEFVAKMKDEDVDYITRVCTGAIERQEGDRWAPIRAADSKDLMYQDIDLVVLVRLIVEVLRENLGDFMTELGDGLTSTSSSDQVSQQASSSG